MEKKVSKRLFFLITLSLFSFISYGQKGVPFISNFELPSTMSNQNWSIIQSDDNHLMYILNRKGVYMFDGFEWTKLNMIGKPIAIFSTSSYLFVGTDLEIGYFKKDKKGSFNYYSVQDSTLDIYYKFIKTDSSIYAVGTQHVSKIVIGEKIKTQPVYIEQDSSQMITDIFELNGIIYIIKNKNSIYRLDEGIANHQPLNLDKDETIRFTFNHNFQSYIGTSSNRLFLFNGWQFKQIPLKDQNYFSASYLNGGISIDTNRFALSTLIGGCSIINAKTFTTEATINYVNGLPDDEIFSMGVDNSKGLWIAHGMGISRVDLNIPVRSFDHYEGINGNVLSVAEYNRTIYVGASEGLYYLTEVKNYNEVETPMIQTKQTQVTSEVSKKNEKKLTESKTQVEEKDAKKKKKGFFARLFSKSDKAETQSFDLPTSDAGTKKGKGEISITMKRLSSLQTVTNAYKRIQGVDGKCKQLLIFSNKLLAATSTGLYEVSVDHSEQIIKGSYILFVKPSDINPKNLFVCSTNGISTLTQMGGSWINQKVYSFESEYPLSLLELNDNNLLVTTEFNIYNLTLVQGGEAIITKLTPTDSPIESPVVLKVVDKIKIYTPNRTFTYNQAKGILVDDGLPALNYNINTIYSQNGYSWVNIGRKWNLFTPEKSLSMDVINYLGLFDRVNDIFINPNNELLIVNGYNQIVKISSSKEEFKEKEFPILLKQATDSKGVKLDTSNIKLSYSNNTLTIKLCAPVYVKEKSVEFQYMIEGRSAKWTEWSSNPVLNFYYFPSGKYKIKIKARDALGRESKEYVLPFVIKPPLWKTPWFIALCVIFILSLFVTIVKVRERQLQRDKQILEQKVKERTEEIMQQKEEIEAQRDEIEAQRDHIFKQNEEITQSIEYAKRIQTAVMPKKNEIDAILPEHFILFKPRDIVSGDFYWLSKKNNKIVVAAADCTWHGVPGAFMSMLGISFLNEIVNGGGMTKPDSVLNRLRHLIKSTLSQTGKEGESKDGMDIALCTIDLEAKKIEYAGAYNPLYLVRNGELTEFKADKMPVGIHMAEKDSFTYNEISFDKGDCIYIFSDGYVSQFGGDSGRTYKSVPFKKMLAIISEKPMQVQHEMLETEFVEWQGFNPQVDDILVVGVRFS